MSILLNGIGVSRGIAIGNAYVYVRATTEATEYNVPARYHEGEIKRLRQAVQEAGAELHEIKNKIASDTPEEILVFIDSHLLMLEDPTFDEGAAAIIREFSCNAEWALQVQCERLVQVFDEMDDPYLRTRKDDVLHVVQRIQHCLSEKPESKSEPVKLKGRIVISDDLTPADTLMMQHQKVAAFVTEFGGPLSHTAILARNLGIPAIVGVHNARQLIHPTEQLIIDGHYGVVIGEPDARSLKHYRKLRQSNVERKQRLNRLINKPTVTKDGVHILLQGNIDRPEDIRKLKQFDNTGVGLYRTEMLFLENNQSVDEETQFKTYKRALFRLKGNPLTIRTLDLGADKEIQESLGQGPMAHNPAMGLRAIRRCLKEPENFIEQLCAILRVAAYGDVKMMIPMLTSIDELKQVKALVDHSRELLRQRKARFNENIEIGAMIEVPAAALSSDIFADQLDFLSIGTNDLIQYTLAIDRIDEEVNYLYNPLHPAVLRLIDITINSGKKARVPVSMCGEMASDPRYTRLLLGMGLNYFSVQANAILEIKDIINNSNIGKLRTRVRKILNCHDLNEIEQRVEKLNA
ncbi:MAG: phosphoenolpyruvate--protein phosphotransferase [Gammaproteobacteria bacterium]|nr:phosphoenolpyruvate--protein phosphotransferase [Gammaproteobacteria bacterium]